MAGNIDITDHRLKLVVEMVGNGAGHSGETFRFLKLPVLRFEFGFFRLRPLPVGDVVNDGVEQSVALQWYGSAVNFHIANRAVGQTVLEEKWFRFSARANCISAWISSDVSVFSSSILLLISSSRVQP